MDQQYSPVPPVPPVQTTSTLAIVSLIAGIVSWFILPFVAAVAAVITGHMAKTEIKKSNGMLGGNRRIGTWLCATRPGFVPVHRGSRHAGIWDDHSLRWKYNPLIPGQK